MAEATGGQPESSAAAAESPALPPWLAWLLIVSLGIGIWLVDVGLDQRPEKVPEWGWRLLAIFLPTILALMLRPIPGGAVVILALLAAVFCEALPTVQETVQERTRILKSMEVALGGYRDPTVWLVLAAYFISRALIKTGLARRIALTFIRRLGGNTLGLSYALVASDTVLAGMIPSNAARVGGVVLPITRSLAELYKSFPGASAPLLGTFLMLTLYQCDVVACATFITGQASNVLAAERASALTKGTVQLHYGNWLAFAVVPALVSLCCLPWLIYRWQRPGITHTPAAAEMARTELTRMGRPGVREWIVIVVFAGVCMSWILTGILINEGPEKYTAVVALSGVGVLLLTGVLTWHDCISERSAWDVFIWYGGLVQLGRFLHEANLTTVFAETVAGALTALPLVAIFVLTLLIYFYAHYGFASITTHILAMYPAFVGVLLHMGAPPLLTTACFAFFSNFCAGLTHYGTTPAPIVFGAGYVSHGLWWRTGLLLSVVNILIWLSVGMAWWKVLGLW